MCRIYKYPHEASSLVPLQGKFQWWRSPSPLWWPAERWAGQWRQDTPQWCTENHNQLWSETPERRGRLPSGSSLPSHRGCGWREGQTLEATKKKRWFWFKGCKQYYAPTVSSWLEPLCVFHHCLHVYKKELVASTSSFFSFCISDRRLEGSITIRLDHLFCFLYDYDY